MKKKHLKIGYLSIIFSLFLFVSCENDINNNLNLKNHENESSSINLSQIDKIASTMKFETFDANKRSITANKEIGEIHEIKNNSNQTSFYIVNYKNGGFIILSADNRAQPILAFSDKNNFILSNIKLNEGLKNWINDSKSYISNLQSSDAKQDAKEKQAWNALTEEDFTLYRVPPHECTEHSETYIKGPLLTTNWEQQNGFNNQMPMVCNSGIQAKAGCVPIAMAQIMRYHEYPTQYNWSAMPATNSTATTASFIKDIHDAIGSVYTGQPQYLCNGGHWGFSFS